jgi:hypothetical protein
LSIRYRKKQIGALSFEKMGKVSVSYLRKGPIKLLEQGCCGVECIYCAVEGANSKGRYFPISVKYMLIYFFKR